MTIQKWKDITKSYSHAGEIVFKSATAIQKAIKFPAFITQFSDNYNVGWGGSQVFGRIDPVKNYQSTSRQITLGFDILSESEEDAKENFENFELLITMLYPVYSEELAFANKARTINAPPLWRIKYANYIHSPTNDEGLLGCIQGLTFQPKFEVGHYVTPQYNLLPIAYSVSLQFQPLHESPIGYTAGGLLNDSFPYGAGTIKGVT